jgi:hypothetical protein
MSGSVVGAQRRAVDRAEQQRAERYRRKAKEIRALAWQMSYLRARVTMLSLARDYEAMAVWTESVAAKLAALKGRAAKEVPPRKRRRPH